MKKSISIFLIIILTISFNIKVFADDNTEETFETSEIGELLEAVTGEANEEPVINSRHAVVYDRKARKSIIWEKRT